MSTRHFRDKVRRCIRLFPLLFQDELLCDQSSLIIDLFLLTLELIDTGSMQLVISPMIGSVISQGEMTMKSE